MALNKLITNYLNTTTNNTSWLNELLHHLIFKTPIFILIIN